MICNDDFKILVLIHNDKHTFGFGKTISEAKTAAKKYLEDGFRFSNNNHRIWIVAPKTIVTDIGNIIPKKDEFKPIDIT